MWRYDRIALSGLLILILSTYTSGQATEEATPREWRDGSGRYSVEAVFVNADDDLVVLESKEELLVVQRKELSEKDQKYVTNQMTDSSNATDNANAKDVRATNATKGDEISSDAGKNKKRYDSTWKLRDGEVVQGSLFGFAEQNYVVNRERGKLYVDGKELENLAQAYGKIIPDIVAKQDKVKIGDSNALEDHIAERGGGPLTYRVEGIQVVLESSETITIPVSLLSKNEMEDVLPGFRRWKASQAEDVSDDERSASSKVERLLLETYGKNPARRLLRQQRRLQFLQLSLLASDVGATNLWQVALHSGRPYTHPYVVLVPAQNSLIAQRRAIAKYPGWKSVGVRQLDH